MKNVFYSFLFLLVMSFGLHGQSIEEIIYDNQNEHEHYGWDMAINGDWLAIGSPHSETELGDDAGKVMIYKRNSNNEWEFAQSLMDEQGNAFQNFGFSVDMAENVLVVGAIGSFLNGPFSGKALVYVLEEGIWVYEATLASQTAKPMDYFGHAVATNGERIVVSAVKADVASEDTGAAFVFKKEDTGWTPFGLLLPNDGASGDHFGYAVDINNQGTIVVGAPHHSDRVYKGGAAYVYQPQSVGYAFESKLYNQAQTEKDFNGISVAISGEDIVIGSLLADGESNNTGACYAFQYDGTDWLLEQSIFSATGAMNDYFGRSIAMSNNRLIIGAPKVNSDSKNNTGAAYYYEKSGGSWNLVTELVDESSAANDYFGQSVAIHPADLSISARLRDGNQTDGGAVYTANLGIITSTEKTSLKRNVSLTAFPNPSQEQLTIGYQLQQPSQVALRLFDQQARSVRVLVEEEWQDAGSKQIIWDLTTDSGQKVASGIYIYELVINGHKLSRRVIVE